MPEAEEREKGTEEILEAITTENFPKLMSDTPNRTSKKLKEHQKILKKSGYI